MNSYITLHHPRHATCFFNKVGFDPPVLITISIHITVMGCYAILSLIYDSYMTLIEKLCHIYTIITPYYNLFDSYNMLYPLVI